MKYLLILLLLISCGTRKTSQQKTTFKSDSLSIENTRVLKQNIELRDIYSIKPFDALKPMVIDGKEYFNATIVYDKSKFDNFEVTEGEKVIRIETEKEVKNKESEKTDYTILFASMFFIAFLFIFLWFKLKKLTPSEF
jgi:hypothetical protein